MAQQKKIKNHIKADHILKKFWKDNSRFADLFNACMFDGEQVLKPNDLTEVDTDISSFLQFNGHAETIQKVLDVVKKTAFGIDFVILGIENQQNHGICRMHPDNGMEDPPEESSRFNILSGIYSKMESSRKDKKKAGR